MSCVEGEGGRGDIGKNGNGSRFSEETSTFKLVFDIYPKMVCRNV